MWPYFYTSIFLKNIKLLVLSVLHTKIALTFAITSLNMKDSDAFYIKACHGVSNILKCRMETIMMRWITFSNSPMNGIQKLLRMTLVK